MDARGRNRYRYRNRESTVIFEVDTDSDDSDTLAFVYRLSIGTDVNFCHKFRDTTLAVSGLLRPGVSYDLIGWLLVSVSR